MKIYILTYCRNLELFYGTELIFKTLRIGFPKAQITVVDNASLPETRPEIESLAQKNNCQFRQIEDPSIQHHDFIQSTIQEVARNETVEGPLIFLDPDICFWDSCEDFKFSGLIAGQGMGKFFDYITETITMPRLHTSFLWISDVKKLQAEIWRLKVRHFDFEPFQPIAFHMDGNWYRYDTGASLYATIGSKTEFFEEKHLRCYDHIFCGSHLDWLYPQYNTECQEMMKKVHTYAKEGNLAALKGIRRLQDDVFSQSFAQC